MASEDSPVIDRLWPEPAEELSDEQLLRQLGFPSDRFWLRMNFISSLDGAATRDGRSGGLGDAADRRVFDLLRYPADAILVGAGTARTEGYDAMRLDEKATAWRREAGLAPQPTLVLVTRSLDLDPGSPMFTDAPQRPIIYTVGSAPRERREALSAVADVVDVGEQGTDPRQIRSDLTGRGLHRIHAEGGPQLFGSMLEAGVVDALHLTLAPSLEVDTRLHITRPSGDDTADARIPTHARLASVLRAGDELLLHYLLD